MATVDVDAQEHVEFFDAEVGELALDVGIAQHHCASDPRTKPSRE